MNAFLDPRFDYSKFFVFLREPVIEHWQSVSSEKILVDEMFRICGINRSDDRQQFGEVWMSMGRTIVGNKNGYFIEFKGQAWEEKGFYKNVCIPLIHHWDCNNLVWHPNRFDIARMSKFEVGDIFQDLLNPAKDFRVRNAGSKAFLQPILLTQYSKKNLYAAFKATNFRIVDYAKADQAQSWREKLKKPNLSESTRNRLLAALESHERQGGNEFPKRTEIRILGKKACDHIPNVIRNEPDEAKACFRLLELFYDKYPMKCGKQLSEPYRKYFFPEINQSNKEDL